MVSPTSGIGNSDIPKDKDMRGASDEVVFTAKTSSSSSPGYPIRRIGRLGYARDENSATFTHALSVKQPDSVKDRPARDEFPKSLLDSRSSPHTRERHAGMTMTWKGPPTRTRDTNLQRCKKIPITARNYEKYYARRQLEYANGTDGKANPSRYGSTLLHDLGLCLVTFTSPGPCEHGVNCWWRHSPLTEAEADWMCELGYTEFAIKCQKLWRVPYVPEPSLPKTTLADFDSRVERNELLKRESTATQAKSTLKSSNSERVSGSAKSAPAKSIFEPPAPYSKTSSPSQHSQTERDGRWQHDNFNDDYRHRHHKSTRSYRERSRSPYPPFPSRSYRRKEDQSSRTHYRSRSPSRSRSHRAHQDKVIRDSDGKTYRILPVEEIDSEDKYHRYRRRRSHSRDRDWRYD